MSDGYTGRDYYNAGGVEAWDAIEAWGLGFNLGNVVKYIARLGRKKGSQALDDLKKARAYLDREIASLEASEGRFHTFKSVKGELKVEIDYSKIPGGLFGRFEESPG